jgi:stress-induced morphogen
MSLLGTTGTLDRAIETAIREAIPDAADVDVRANGNHFSLRVVSASFEGRSTIQKHRMVLSAVSPFMSGDDAPVHAIDQLVCELP